MRQKHSCDYFDFNQSYLTEGKIASVVLCLMRQNKNTLFCIGGSGLDWWFSTILWIRTGSDWWFSTILPIRTGSDSILSDQDWTRTEKFHSLLISVPCQRIWERIRTGSDWIRTEDNFGRIRTGSDCNFFQKWWTGLDRTEKILLFLCDYSENIKNFSCDPISRFAKW